LYAREEAETRLTTKQKTGGKYRAYEPREKGGLRPKIRASRCDKCNERNLEIELATCEIHQWD